MHVFVTGATGIVGRALCGALVSRGDFVTALSRSAGSAAARLPAGVRILEGDPAAPGRWQEELARADACVHLAGEPMAAGRLTAARKAKVAASRLDSTRLVAEVIAAGGPEVLVSGSAVGFYGSRGDEVLDETSPPGGDAMAELCRRWEAAAVPATAEARVVLLRTGIVLSDQGGALPELVRPFRLFAGGPLGDGAFWQPWIHLADEVGLILLALEDGKIAGPLCASAPEPVRNRDLAATLGKVLHRPAFVSTPALAVRLAVGDLADIVLASQRMVPTLANECGYLFRFPTLEPALRDLLA